MRLNPNETNIPDNIHIIYSNFVHIHNLLYKHTVHQLKLLQKMENDLNKRCSKISDLQNNMKVIAHMGDESEDESEGVSNNTSFY